LAFLFLKTHGEQDEQTSIRGACPGRADVGFDRGIRSKQHRWTQSAGRISAHRAARCKTAGAERTDQQRLSSAGDFATAQNDATSTADFNQDAE
jgi:hypothetical protein